MARAQQSALSGMSVAAWYNENDPFAAAWLRNLIAAGHLPPGDVDERSVVDVRADDLRGYAQCHFFAGIGGWAYALELAGWDAARPVWTGSCPCQPFSSAGRQGGALDERHLWPWWLRLIRECRPDAVFGEQVEGAVGFGWIDRVFADLEDEGYATGAAVLGAHSLGAPHIRQRLFWVAQPGGAAAGCAYAEPAGSSDACGLADADEAGSGAERRAGLSGDRDAPQRDDADGCGEAGGLGDSDNTRSQGRGIDAGEHPGQWAAGAAGAERRMADSDERAGRQGSALGNGRNYRGHAQQGAGSGGGCDTGWLGNTASEQMGRARQPWQDSVWLPCLDGKARRVEPTIQPLAHGIRNRVGLLRGSGNAIVPQVAAEFVSAFMEAQR